MKTKPGPAASTDRPYARALELPSEQTARTSPQTQTTSLASSQLYPINMVVNGERTTNEINKYNYFSPNICVQIIEIPILNNKTKKKT